MIPRILIVEDNPGDFRLIGEAFRKAGFSGDILGAESAEEAIRSLRRVPISLVVLDLNLGRSTGFEVLDQVRADAELKVLPIVIFSGTDDPEIIRLTYDHGANAFLHKSASLNDFLDTVQSCYRFWFGSSILPDIALPKGPHTQTAAEQYAKKIS